MKDNELSNDFVRQFSDCERELYSYVFSLVPSHTDASDILQNTALELWKRHETYDQKRPFRAWARKFAYIQILKSYEKSKHRNWMLNPFDESVASSFTEEFELHSGVLELRRMALGNCIGKLGADDLDILRERYWKQGSLRKLAGEVGSSEHQVYRKLKKIRSFLHSCIEQQIVGFES